MSQQTTSGTTTDNFVTVANVVAPVGTMDFLRIIGGVKNTGANAFAYQLTYTDINNVGLIRQGSVPPGITLPINTFALNNGIPLTQVSLSIASDTQGSPTTFAGKFETF